MGNRSPTHIEERCEVVYQVILTDGFHLEKEEEAIFEIVLVDSTDIISVMLPNMELEESKYGSEESKIHQSYSEIKDECHLYQKMKDDIRAVTSHRQIYVTQKGQLYSISNSSLDVIYAKRVIE